MARSLRVPPYGNVHLVADSTLKLTPPTNPETGRRPKNKPTATHYVRDNNWGTELSEQISSGATLEDLSLRFLGVLTQEQIDSKDCTICVCMLNAPNGARQLISAGRSGMGAHVVELCQRLLLHKRAAIMLGGCAELCGFNDHWDPMVKTRIYMCRAHGIPTIDGAHYFRNLEREGGGGTS